MKCYECGAELDWIETPDGFYGVDIDPAYVIVGGGQDVFFDDNGDEIRGRKALCREVKKRHKRLPLLWRPHGQTCKALRKERRRGISE